LILNVCNLAIVAPSYVLFNISHACLDDSVALILGNIDSSTALPMREIVSLSFFISSFKDLLSE
jgi:hypothetical protein